MTEKIKLLPDSVANQIAAGEVVGRPASVVKEMMENAVDAGATSITVNFRDGGKELIQVIDNGSGMSPVDARMAFDRHATSKISKVEDIYSLSTFGFRGEALASIAAVAEVELLTKEADAELGTRVEVAGGRFVAQSAAHCEKGTRFMVRNLFYNVPARRRFLDKSTTEARHITAEFQRVALINPDIEFALYSNDAPVYSLPAASIKQRIVGVIGKNISGNLLEVSAGTTIVNVEGYVGRPAASKHNNREQYLFVNGRYFRSAYFHKAIVSAYDRLIPAGTQPAYFICLSIDRERIDVNVHPQKTEVKFDDGSAVWQIINAAVRESLAKLGVVPMMDFDMDTDVEIPVLREDAPYRIPEITADPGFNPFTQRRPPQHGITPDGEFDEFARSISEEAYGDASSVLEYIEGETAAQTAMEIDGGAVFQGAVPLGNRYAVTAAGDMLTIVDTIRAREAILYDRLRTMLRSGHSVSQQLLFPESVALSVDDYTLMKEHADDFSLCGFEIIYRDGHTVEIMGVPSDLTSGAVRELIYDMLDSLRDRTRSPERIRTDRLAAAMARIGAVSRGGCTADRTGALLDELMKCSDPSHTPSGKSVMISFGMEEIKKRFK